MSVFSNPLVTEALVALLVVVFGLVAEVGRRHLKTLTEVREHAEAARDQVQNNHATNLRHDVDQVIAGIEQLLEGQQAQAETLRSHGYELGHLRRDLQQERVERHALSERVDGHVQAVASATAATVAAVVGTDSSR